MENLAGMGLSYAVRKPLIAVVTPSSVPVLYGYSGRNKNFDIPFGTSGVI